MVLTLLRRATTISSSETNKKEETKIVNLKKNGYLEVQWFPTIYALGTPYESAEKMEGPVRGEGKRTIWVIYYNYLVNVYK